LQIYVTIFSSALLSLTLGPSPGGRGKLKPFALREKGWDEGKNCHLEI
jgi:hypothetical protein